jgi:hypothetical protein
MLAAPRSVESAASRTAENNLGIDSLFPAGEVAMLQPTCVALRNSYVPSADHLRRNLQESAEFFDILGEHPSKHDAVANLGIAGRDNPLNEQRVRDL